MRAATEVQASMSQHSDLDFLPPLAGEVSRARERA
jgi:hypothetical protein